MDSFSFSEVPRNDPDHSTAKELNMCQFSLISFFCRRRRLRRARRRRRSGCGKSENVFIIIRQLIMLSVWRRANTLNADPLDFFCYSSLQLLCLGFRFSSFAAITFRLCLAVCGVRTAFFRKFFPAPCPARRSGGKCFSLSHLRICWALFRHAGNSTNVCPC